MTTSGPLFIPKGFRFSSLAAGIKASGNPDLALILAEQGTTAAALFTRNRIVAAPVEVGRAALKTSRGRVRAVLVNSGNANCATGRSGLKACTAACTGLAKLLRAPACEIFPSSTGIIGVPLPVTRITGNLGALLNAASNSADHFRCFTEAILTTDTRSKTASIPLKSGVAAITGVAKGSGMIHPQLATMLVYILTDVVATAGELKTVLRRACDKSFNVISVDGDTSTNDTVLLLASGQSGVRLKNIHREFENALSEVCQSLAEQIVADGEGVQHVVRLTIKNARNRKEALQVARAVSHSLLVKTAWAGADPNWGRILAAVGRSGVALDPSKIDLTIGDQLVCKGAVVCPFDEERAHQELSLPECNIAVRLGRGTASLQFLTSDLTSEYVRINADYST
jgi:glutamate N-acetyltransferase / amino-acid N-acetyltransferase